MSQPIRKLLAFHRRACYRLLSHFCPLVYAGDSVVYVDKKVPVDESLFDDMDELEIEDDEDDC